MKITGIIVGEEKLAKRIKNFSTDSNIEFSEIITDDNSFFEKINRLNPNIIVIIDDGLKDVYRICEQIYALKPKSIPIVITALSDVNSFKKIIKTGVHHILEINTNPKELIINFSDIYANELIRFQAIEQKNDVSLKSKVISVFGTKGGIGKTSIAVNLAVALTKKKYKVALLDYSLQFGDSNIFLGIHNSENISSMLEDQQNLNIDTIRQFMSIHNSGLHILNAPKRPEHSENISQTQTDKIISVLRAAYDFVIIDCPPTFNDVTIATLELSTKIIFVTGMDIASINNSKKGISVISSLVSKDKIFVVIGKEYPSKIKISDINKILDTKILVSIPEESKINIDALNQGIPVIVDSPTSKTAKAILSLVGFIEK